MRILTLLYKCTKKIKLSLCGISVFNERENIKLLLSSMQQFHATNILAALLKRSVLCRCLRVVPFGIITMFRNVEKLK